MKKFCSVLATIALALASLLAMAPAKAASAGLATALTVASSNFSGPSNVVVGGDFVWVVNQTSRKITKVDRFSGTVLGSTSAFADTPNKISWDGVNAWISFLGGGKFAKIDQSLNVTLSSVVCSSGLFNDSVAAASGRVFVSCWNSKLVAELNVSTLAIAQSTTNSDFNFGLRANNSNVYIDSGSSVKIYNADNLATAPVVVTTGMPTNSLHQMTLDADYFWMVGFNNGQTTKLGRLRLSDRSVTIYTVSSVAGASHNPIATDGRFVYLPNTTTNAFESFDISAGTWGVEVANTTPTGVATTPGEVWAILAGALVKYSTNVQSVSWAPSNVSNALIDSPVTPNALASSSGGGAISYAVASAGTAQCTVDSSSAVITAQSVGTCTIRALAAATANESSGFADVVFTFSAQVQTVTWSPTNTSIAVSVGSLTPNALAQTTGTGAISYAVLSSGGTGCQVNSVTAVLSFTTAGSCVVRATAAAGGGFGAGSADVTFNFTLQSQTVTWAPTNTSVSVSASTLTPNALASRSGSGTISYSISSPGATSCAVNASSAVITFSGAGSCLVRATVSASGGYSSAYTEVAFTITLQSQSVAWLPTNTSVALPLISLTPNALATSSGPGSISYSVNSAGSSGCTVNSSTGVLAFTSDGTCVVRATAAAGGGYNSGFVDVPFTILPDPNSISISSNVNSNPTTSSKIAIHSLSPRFLVVGDTPLVKLKTDQAGEVASISIAGITSVANVDAFGELAFTLPKLSLGVHALQISFSSSGNLTFIDAFTVTEKQPARDNSVEIVSRLAFTPKDTAGIKIDAQTKRTISNLAGALGPIISLKCIGFVSNSSNSASARKSALARVSNVCKTAALSVSADSYSVGVNAVRGTPSSLRKILLELVFKK